MNKILIFFFIFFLFIFSFSEKITFENFDTFYENNKIAWDYDISYEGSILYYLNFKNLEIPQDLVFITEYKSVLISGTKKGYTYKLKVTAKNIDREFLGKSDEATLIIYDNDEEPLRIIGTKIIKNDDEKIIHFILRNVSQKIITSFEMRYWGLDILGNPIRINRRSFLKHEEKNIEILPFEFYDVYITIENKPALRFAKGDIWEITFNDESFWKKIIE
ncbi:hypothetical protein SAMN02745164_00215 [Marinitoga hydrogenitolerans DSM 16785]|uniref:Uncharacterized protein n=1 Tax=Marinitoga hydrogenitolerans (strain DSM 16785 / JCM 12826 / AT1271) TaxID=1122195 RepID=A0A1M4SK71_MARH1|nr:hypothetical protein [Marinitoga hydrogenitolerans]SHE32596.1 hypothetical protein SAMN02745164_00215 [Marinitoga hydrogenitolerans DSM 16785]